MPTLDDETARNVKELAETFSKHAKYVNQVWLATIVATIFVILPNEKDGVVSLPFSLGVVNKSVYAPVGFFILVVLIVAYCQGYAKAYDARKFVHGLLDEMELKNPSSNLRDFYDFFVVDSIARVWPLVSLLRYRFSFPKLFAKSFYVALKILTQGILLGLPVSVLAIVFWRVVESYTVAWILLLAIVAQSVVAMAVLEMILAEIGVVRDVLRRLDRD